MKIKMITYFGYSINGSGVILSVAYIAKLKHEDEIPLKKTPKETKSVELKSLKDV